MTGQQPDALVEAVALVLSLEIGSDGPDPDHLAAVAVAEIRAHHAARSLRQLEVDVCRHLGLDPALVLDLHLGPHEIVAKVARLNAAGRRHLDPATGTIAQDIRSWPVTDRPRTPEPRG